MEGNGRASFYSALKKNIPAAVLLAAGLGLAAFQGRRLGQLPAMVDWNTIFTLSGLLLTTNAIKESGFFSLVASKMVKGISDERLLAVFLIFMAAVLSMFLTNDIALFIVVPLTLKLQELACKDYRKIIIFEAIAVNAGSSLTPIGNPQNIFLWHQWGISFPVFVREMSPLVLVMAAWLLLFVFASFQSREIKVAENGLQKVDRKLFVLSVILLVLFIIATERGYGPWFLTLMFLILMAVRKGLILRCDWGLMVLFIAIFIDLHLVCQLKPVQQFFAMLDLQKAPVLLLSGAALSQVMSNVPAAILLAHHSANFKMIAYGVNVGGNGFIISSFANLIALRFCTGKNSYLTFHLYSIPYLLVTLACVYYLLI